MDKLIECVPNFSEGRNKETIESIARSIRETEGCNLLDVDPGASTNRTVFTFVGNPSAVVNGALNAAKVAHQLIDMTSHKGEHPRFGAMDVCPFIPIRNATMEDCVQIANCFASQLAQQLNVPVYLYGAAATQEERRLLPNIRSGEYEKLEEKLKDLTWKPDYGPQQFVPRWGATAVGARKFLIAYNVNLMSTKEQATKIAFNIRERGRGESKRGRLKNVQGIGWYLDERNLAQVSTNITDTDVTKLHQVFEEVVSDAKKYNLPVVGSEIVGLVPLQVLLDAAEFYISRDNLMILDESSKVNLARHQLGLDFLKPFNPDERVIEYAIRNDAVNFPISTLSVKSFVDEVAKRSEAPGGGSVSAAVAAMGAALGCMVAQLSYGKKKWESIEHVIRENLPVVYNAATNLVPLIDRDTEAFNCFFKALKMPDSTQEEKDKKKAAKHDGIMLSVTCPLTTMSTANSAWDALMELAIHGNINCVSDIQVGAKCLHTGVWGAYQNVKINLPEVKDQDARNKLRIEADEALGKADECLEKILQIVQQRQIQAVSS